MNLAEKLFFLRKVPLLAGLDEQDLLRVADIAVEGFFEPGETLFLQGDPGGSLFIIMDGQVSIEVDGFAAEILGSGQFFGEVTVLAAVPRTAGAVARTGTYTLSIGRGAFLRLFERSDSLRLNVVRELGKKVGGINERERRLAGCSKRSSCKACENPRNEACWCTPQ